MKQINNILKDLGFNAEAPLPTQKALFRHLVHHAEMVHLQNSREGNSPTEKQNMTDSSEQLSFDERILGLVAK